MCLFKLLNTANALPHPLTTASASESISQPHHTHQRTLALVRSLASVRANVPSQVALVCEAISASSVCNARETDSRVEQRLTCALEWVRVLLVRVPVSGQTARQRVRLAATRDYKGMCWRRQGHSLHASPGHTYGLSPVCVRMWLVRLLDTENDAPQLATTTTWVS